MIDQNNNMRARDTIPLTDPPIQADDEEGASAPPPTLAERVRAVHELRDAYSILKAKLDQIRHQWEWENRDDIDALACCRSELEQQETALRDAAVTAYAETGNNKPSPGVAIRILRVSVYDPVTAMGWALEHRMFLSLDRKAFETYLKASPGTVPFGEIISEVQVTIATDLGKILEVAE